MSAAPDGRIILDAALKYNRRGFNVVACTCKGKRPIGSWRAWQSKRQSEDDVRGMFEGSDHNIGVITGSISRLVVFDIDAGDAHDPWDVFNDLAGANPATPIVITPRGLHIWCAHPIDFSVPNATRLNDTVIDVRGDGGLVIAPPSVHPSGDRYRFDDVLGLETPLAPIPEKLLALVRSTVERSSAGVTNEGWTRHLGREISTGERNDTLASVAGGLVGRGLKPEEALGVLEIVNEARCRPPLDQGELGRIVVSITRAEERGDLSRKRVKRVHEAPGDLPEAAYHGAVGEVIRCIEPHSEASPAAMLFQELAMLGSVIGPRPHVRIEDDIHPARIWPAIMGDTSKARKGLSFGRAVKFASLIDPEWSENLISPGLSSGEGLIYAVRDPVERYDPESGSYVVVDAGVTDKRLLVPETELGNPLKQFQRAGNILSQVMRQAWDTGKLATLTRKDSGGHRATGAHITVILHGTLEELRILLAGSELHGGWVNRFIWVAASRARVLPLGGDPDRDLLKGYATQIGKAIRSATAIGAMNFDSEARSRWVAVYPELSAPRPGLLGDVLARSEAQTLRLAVIYALLDGSPVIRIEHLEAALALWQYAEQSAAYIFGEFTGDQLADRLYREICSRPEGISRNEIYDFFGRNQRRDRIDLALAALAKDELTRSESIATGGRPEQRWYALNAITRKGMDDEKGS
jgi:hypothetical protein